MINIGRLDLLLSYVAYFLRFGSALIVLPLLLSRLSSSEYGLWLVFLALGNLALLVDLGFGPVITRFVTYAYCGATSLPASGLPTISGEGAPNYELLYRVYLASRHIYIGIGGIALVVLLASTFYIDHVAKGASQSIPWSFAWLTYALGVVLSILFSYHGNIFKGLGHVRQLQTITIVNQLVYITLQCVLLSRGWGLDGLALSNLCAALLLKLQLWSRTRALLRVDPAALKLAKADSRGDFRSTYRVISSNSKGMGLILGANFVQTQGNTLLAAAFLSLPVAASLGLTTQLVGILTAVSAIPFATYLPRLNALQLSGRRDELRDLYSITTVAAFVIVVAGGAIILSVGTSILAIMRSGTPLLTTWQTAILLLYALILANHQRSTNFILTSNRQPHVRSYVISSLVTLALSVTLLLLGLGVLGILIANLLVQVAYNGWRWPQEALRSTGMTVGEMIRRSLAFIARRSWHQVPKGETGD